MRIRDMRTGTIMSTDDETANNLLRFSEYEEVKDEKPATRKAAASKDDKAEGSK